MTILQKTTILFCAIIAIGGCSNQAIYENVQQDRKRECEQLQAHDRQRCLAGYERSYEEYEEEREKLLSDDK